MRFGGSCGYFLLSSGDDVLLSFSNIDVWMTGVEGISSIDNTVSFCRMGNTFVVRKEEEFGSKVE